MTSIELATCFWVRDVFAKLSRLVRVFIFSPSFWPGKVAVRPEVRLRLFLEYLGGAWIKIGQALALRFDLLPNEYCAELLKLLNQTPTVPYEAIRQTILRELGSFPEQIFASFDPVPHATASIAQVHIATTHDGEKLAIKVQRPRVQEQFEADFRIFRMMSYLVGLRGCVRRNRASLFFGRIRKMEP